MHLSYFPSVPYGPPENITSNATHDQIIIFTDGIHPAQKNGIILGYDIFYLEVSKLPASVSQYQHTNVSAGDPLKVENLEPFTNYSIFIRGFNKIGASPLANFTRQTGEWGKTAYMLLSLVIVYLSVTFIFAKHCFAWADNDKMRATIMTRCGPR